jgi:hypothetical protein
MILGERGWQPASWSASIGPLEIPDVPGAPSRRRSLFPVGGEIMSRIVGGVLLLLLALPALGADDKPKDQPLTPQ